MFKGDGKLYPESLTKVGFDSERIWVKHPNQDEKSILWKDLIGVAIRTTDEGPLNPDVLWILGTKEKTLVFPGGATGESNMIERLQTLPNFDNEAVISAMGSAFNNTFICWENK
ncbi:MAG: hypothetical protein A2Z19_07625 [Deltaproteobacteria bacterium RBG_16_54_18]|nr:MAG: hypothetical protein A2Z19_07625 [Deltaproteobacteria bacterium RBG_16_54_18]